MIASDVNTIVRERQLVIRRQLDLRGISLKALAFDSGLPYPTIVSYFPGEKDKVPHTVSGAALYALCGALPADLLSLLLPDGWQIVRAPEMLNHDELCEVAEEYLKKKMAAHHPDSEAGREIGPTEQAELDATVVQLRAAAA